MKKRVFIVHGWDGYPEQGWFPWLKKELEAKGFEVFVPELPEPGSPRIYNWVPKLAEVVGIADENTYFVGHSMGCQTIARFIESLPEGVEVGGAVFVAGFFKKLSKLEDDAEVRDIAKHWLESKIDFQKIKHRLPKSIAIFSDDDPYVPLDNRDEYENLLGSKIIVEHGKGHFNAAAGALTLPIALDAILELASESESGQS